MTYSQKPPLGVMPKYIYDYDHPYITVEDAFKRMSDIQLAMIRYKQSDYPDYPIEWAIELGELIAFCQSKM